MLTRILLDMDGVVTNFVGSVLVLFDMPRERFSDVKRWEVEALIQQERFPKATVPEVRKEMWRRIDNRGQEWWENLEFFSWADGLYEMCSSMAEVFICSTPPHYPGAIAGKLVWLQKWLGYDFRNYIFTPVKKTLATGRDVVLIDDYEVNIEKFKQSGGSGVLFPQPWNVPGRLFKQVERIAYVKARLVGI